MPLPYRIVTVQALLTVVVAAGLLIWNSAQAIAALQAGVSCLLPGAWFAWRAVVERSPGRLLGQGVLKFVLTLGMLAVCIILFRPAAAGFFGTFAVLQAVYVVGPLVFREGQA